MTKFVKEILYTLFYEIPSSVTKGFKELIPAFIWLFFVKFIEGRSISTIIIGLILILGGTINYFKSVFQIMNKNEKS